MTNRDITRAELICDHAVLMELLDGLQLAVDNARDYETLKSLLSEAIWNALEVSHGMPRRTA